MLHPTAADRKHVAFLPCYYLYDIHLGIAHYAREADWILNAEFARSGKLPTRWQGDGIICTHSNDDSVIKFIRESGVPAIDLGWETDKIELPRVITNNAAIGQMAAEHLISRGYQRIGFVSYAPDNPFGSERREGLRAAVEAVGLDFLHIKERELETWLKDVRLPVALMTENDDLALRLLETCHELGLLVPEQIAVLGVGNDAVQIETARVPLSSVNVKFWQVGWRAAELLDRLMAGDEPPEEPILVSPLEVVVRASTNILAVDHKPSAKALRYIWDHYREPIDLNELSRYAGMCRRRLDDAFREHVGRTMAKEILRLRIRDASRMLADTDQKIGVISDQLGFVNGAHLTRVFKRERGITPKEFRNRAKR